MISGSFDCTLRLWNMSTYQCITVIDGVDCCSTNLLYQIDKDRVIVGGEYTFSIVNIDKNVIEKTVIIDKSFRNVNCFLKLRDNHTIICGCKNDGKLYCYDMNTEEYKITKNIHEYGIQDLLLIDDSTFLSCSIDTTIKVRKY